MQTREYTAEQRRTILEDVAQGLFSSRGGARLIDTIADIDGTLIIYRQDVQRGMENESPHKFRWRVSPSVAQRLRRERRQLIEEVKKLRSECEAEAERQVTEFCGPAQPVPAPEATLPETTPTVEVSRRENPAESEAAQHAPTHKAA